MAFRLEGELKDIMLDFVNRGFATYPKFCEKIALFKAHTGSSIESKTEKFYDAHPKNKSIESFWAELTGLSVGLFETEHERQQAILGRFLKFVPSMIRLQINKKVKRNCTAMDNIRVILENDDLVREIEKSWAKITIHQLQNQDNGNEQPSSSTSKGGFKKPKKTLRCRRCGVPSHVSEDCPLYVDESEQPCSHCLKFTSWKHMHREQDCLLKNRLKN